MNRIAWKMTSASILACSMLLIAEPAEAFRCGNRIIRDGMHETQVRELCGDPVSTRHLGIVLRSYYPRHANTGGMNKAFYLNGVFNEVMVTELVYNFGPRKLMRILRFEGGYLVDTKTAGYGYLAKDNQ
jgi:hypothetical protein